MRSVISLEWREIVLVCGASDLALVLSYGGGPMKRKARLLEKVLCDWLGWHWPKRHHWHHAGKTHATCRICHRVVSW